MKKTILILTGICILVSFSLISCNKGGGSAESAAASIEEVSQDFASISQMKGKIRVIRNNKKFVVSKSGVGLRKNDRIETTSGSKVDITLKDRGVIQLKENSQFTLNDIDKEGNVKAELKKGKLLCALKKLEKKKTFTIKTPTGVAGVRGTSFVISSDTGTSSLSVLTGKVEVKNNSGQTVVVNEKKSTVYDSRKVDPIATIRGKKLLECRWLLEIDGIETTGEVERMKANIRALEIADKKGIEDIDADRKLDTRNITGSKKDVTVDSQGGEGSADIGDKSTEFESDDDMMIK